MSGKTLVSKLSKHYQSAARAAVQVSKNSYCPYSGFSVGAALIHPDGTITAGCNWENCTYQATCAERCAIVKANSVGERAAVAVAVYGKVLDAAADPNDDSVVSPCGLCRQQLNEVAQLAGVDMDVIMVARNTTSAQVVKLSSLLPIDFGPSEFGVSLDKWSVKAGTKRGARASVQSSVAPKAAATKQRANVAVPAKLVGKKASAKKPTAKKTAAKKK
eukprot:CAMPEP_0174829466 /NCGR_PEP_ID=MMETSP1114-20130205/1946_1 /TAXON_ID=312471 /ORGANISM="Neobodo designis, Strain CCAP 1951/1" /LENGTH=217 /DNA_ID=CAMNT_0016063215 /DNA_START=43 /DNA_END=696 /DNA_ORIENTATION=-